MTKAAWTRDDLDGEFAEVGDFRINVFPTLDGYSADVASGRDLIARSERTYPNMELAKMGAYVLAERVLTAALSNVQQFRPDRRNHFLDGVPGRHKYAVAPLSRALLVYGARNTRHVTQMCCNPRHNSVLTNDARNCSLRHGPHFCGGLQL